METFCNQRYFTAPPTCNLKIKIAGDKREIFRTTKQVLDTCVETLSDQSLLSSELYVLTRLIYKMNCQFRREKSLQILRRIETCLKRYFELDLLSIIDDLKAGFDGCDLQQDEVYLPSRQMMEYVLVRLLGSALLLSKTSSYCITAYVYIKQHLSLGNFISTNLLFTALVSRIWVLCKASFVQICTWYEDLYQCVDILQSADVQWLPQSLVLPVNVKSILPKTPEIQIHTSGANTAVDMDIDNIQSDVRDDKLPVTAEMTSSSKTDNLGIDDGYRHEDTLDFEDVGTVVEREMLADSTFDKSRIHQSETEINTDFGVISNSCIQKSSMDRLFKILEHIEENYKLGNDEYFKKCKRRLSKFSKKSENGKQKKKWLRNARGDVLNLFTYATIEKSPKVLGENFTVSESVEEEGTPELKDVQTSHDLKKLQTELKLQNRLTIDGKIYIVSKPEAQIHISKKLYICQRMLVKYPDDKHRHLKKLLKKIKLMSCSVLQEDNSASRSQPERQKKRKSGERIEDKSPKKYLKKETDIGEIRIPTATLKDETLSTSSSSEMYNHQNLFRSLEEESVQPHQTHSTDEEMEAELQVLKDLQSKGEGQDCQTKGLFPTSDVEEIKSQEFPDERQSPPFSLDSVKTVESARRLMEKFGKTHKIIIGGNVVWVTDHAYCLKIEEKLRKFCQLMETEDKEAFNSLLDRMKTSVTQVVQNFKIHTGTSASHSKEKPKQRKNKKEKKKRKK